MSDTFWALFVGLVVVGASVLLFACGAVRGASEVCRQMGYEYAVFDGDQWACEQTPERIVPRGEER